MLHYLARLTAVSRALHYGRLRGCSQSNDSLQSGHFQLGDQKTDGETRSSSLASPLRSQNWSQKRLNCSIGSRLDTFLRICCEKWRCLGPLNGRSTGHEVLANHSKQRENMVSRAAPEDGSLEPKTKRKSIPNGFSNRSSKECEVIPGLALLVSYRVEYELVTLFGKDSKVACFDDDLSEGSIDNRN